MTRKPDPELIDDEIPELDAEWFARARPAKEVLPSALYAALTDKSRPVIIEHVSDAEHVRRREVERRRGRPPEPADACGAMGFAEGPKVPTTIRLDADVMDAFRATGRGWQTRINAVLREALENGRM